MAKLMTKTQHIEFLRISARVRERELARRKAVRIENARKGKIGGFAIAKAFENAAFEEMVNWMFSGVRYDRASDV